MSAQPFGATSPSGSTAMLPNNTSVADGPVAEHGRLTVVGNLIVGEHGKPVRLRGLSLFWSQWGERYWNADIVEWLHRDWGIDVVRAAVGVEHGGYLKNPEREKEKLHTVVQAAVDSGIYVIIDWHDHAANLHTEQAKEFFEEMASAYGSLPNVLFETFNEPTSQSWVQVVKPYHEEILQIIRRYSRNIVICGTPTWSQDVDVASFDEIAGENIAYSLHFYAGTHTKYLRDKAVTALCNCVALFVSEWGACEATGNGELDFVEAKRWLQFLKEHNISDASWAVNDKAESCSMLKLGASEEGQWTSKDLTEAGKWIRRSLREAAQLPVRRLESHPEDTVWHEIKPALIV